MEQSISSRDNERVKRACRLRDSAAFRVQEGAFFAEGVRLCTDLAACLPPMETFCTQQALAAHPQLAALPGARFVVSEPVAHKLSDTKNPQGVFCVFPRRASSLAAVAGGRRYVCLEHVQDPANVGALLRSAAAFGFSGAVLCENCADPFAPKAVRASMGAVAKVDIVLSDETKQALATFKACGLRSFAAALEGSVSLETVDVQGLTGLAVLIGNEGNGLSAGTVALADTAVRIPMAAGVESLNAAVAGGVLLWHFRGCGV